MRTDRGADSSLLVKPPAIAVWLVVCVISIMYDKTAIGVFAAFVFLLTLSSLLWARASLKNVEYSLTVDRTGMFPGQSFVIARTIRNHKALPMLWVEIRELCSLEDCAAPNADVIVEKEIINNPEEDPVKVHERLYTLSLVKWRQTARFMDEWTAKRRGIMEIDASLLRSGDGFGLCAESTQAVFPSPRRIVVYPRLADVSAADILNDMWDTKSESDGYLKDRTVIKSVRDYLPGDAARDINMRLLARGQTIKTNVFETVTPDTVLFVLDSGSFRGGAPEVFEDALSVAAALIDALTKRGINTALMTPASRWFEETCTEPTSLESGRNHMFELLAAVSADDAAFTDAAFLTLDEPGRVYVICADTARLTFSAGASRIPEHKIVYLSAFDSGAGDGMLRTGRLFDYERAV